MRLFVLSLVFITGCAIQKPSATSSTNYSEDLSVLRPEVDDNDSTFTVTPAIGRLKTSNKTKLARAVGSAF